MSFLKKAKLHVSSFILFCLVVGLGTFIARRVPRKRSVSVAAARARGSGSREPASIQRVFDFSYLQGEALQTAAKQRLLSSVSIAREDGDAVIEVGNFVLLNDNNQKDFACGYYDQVELTFNAEGVAVNGERPELTIHTGCQVGDNINFLNPIRLPIDKLTAQAPATAEYKFFDSASPLTVDFVNPPPQWPRKWQLTGIKLTHSQHASRVLHVTANDLQGAGNVMMNW